MNVIERLAALVEKRTWTLDETLFVTRTTLPPLLTAARTLWEEGCRESGTTTESCWDHEADDWPRREWCRRCTALEPLFREDPS